MVGSTNFISENIFLETLYLNQVPRDVIVQSNLAISSSACANCAILPSTAWTTNIGQYSPMTNIVQLV